jgi:hypothetical protein
VRATGFLGQASSWIGTIVEIAGHLALVRDDTDGTTDYIPLTSLAPGPDTKDGDV